jgi:hypothetical protein
LLDDDDIRKLQQAIMPKETGLPNRSGPASSKAIGGQTMTFSSGRQRREHVINFEVTVG